MMTPDIDDDCTPMVSTVIITYDRDTSYLSRSLDSVLNQTTPTSELIIVDGGTEEHCEKTQNYIDSIESTIPIRLIGRTDMRAPEARNLGASQCTGEYIAFLDDDDEWYPDKLKSQLSLSESKPALIYSPYDEEVNGRVRRYQFDENGYPSILSRNIIGCTSFPLVRKDVFDGVGGFDESFQSNQEWDLAIRILKDHDAAFCDVMAGLKHDNPGITSDVRKRLSGWNSIFRKHLSEYRDNPERYRKAAYTFYREMKKRRYPRGIASSSVRRLRAFLRI